MTLATSRIVFQGETPYPHEREAIDFAIKSLPNSDPYHLWALLELLDPSTGRLYELDLLVLGYSALYLIEIKSGPGIYEGDYQDWYRIDPDDERSRYMENPYRLTNHKSKVLASRLRSKMKDKRLTPWVEPLVFLSAENIDLRFKNHGDVGVVTRDNLVRAVQHHDFPGANTTRHRRRITAPAARQVAAAINELGLRPRKGKAHAGAYELGDILEDGPGYQDRIAAHRKQKTITCRARTYLVPQQTSVERRQQLLRAADRESQLLWDVREHPNVLRISGYETDAPLGPTVLFDSFEGGVPLSTFLRQNPKLPFMDRVTIVEQVGRALAFCHRKQIVHGALSPEAVLVRRHPESEAIETRLFNFQLGVGTEVEATTHWSALASEPWAVYQAPELREDPTARTPQSDVFSLGALAYYVFTGEPPGPDYVAVARRLRDERHLDPRAVDDGIQEDLADLIAFATKLSPISRADDVDGWLELVLGEITKPEPQPTEPETDPLEARKGDNLGDDLLVDGVLGQGATSRVLLVGRVSDGRHYALKVPLSNDHDERLEAEAEALCKLRHPRIVQLVERYTFAGRSCLLLSLAGGETLHRHLAREGTISLELAERYGDDLLSAIEYLEEHQVMHRDIKPANLGVGSVSKTRAHLTLFDFSLAHSSRSDLKVGTAAYRDPFLDLRGSWDNAAERWSAAITLHEMLTGVRPAFDGVAIDADSKLLLAAERFDPSVRDSLVDFFQRALARDTEQRFVSAEEMRRAWVTALAAPARASVQDPASEHPDDDDELTEEQLGAIGPETLIEALPLSPRAKNALDRAGLLRAEDLLDLPDNRLSAIRGIGRRVAQEILGFRDRWRAARELTPVTPTPFFAGYRGDDILVHTAGIEEEAATALRDAGLRSLGAIAGAPKHQIRALAKRHDFDERALRELLDAENRNANERERPSTIEGWVDALMPKRKRRMKHPRRLYGIEGTFTARLGVAVKELAEDQDVTTAAIYIALGKARDEWGKHGAIGELRKEVSAVLGAASGALPLDRAARHLLARIPHDRTTSDELLEAQAGALVRIVVEVEKEEDDGLQYIRLGGGQPWLFASDAHARAVKALGEAADMLAARPVLAGKGETERVLADTVAGTPLANVSSQRLAELAALASEGAARSSRLELYPRGMSPERALSLSASLLRSGIGPEEVLRRVSLRYPEAAALPSRPELDALLSRHGLTWNDGKQTYERRGASEKTSFHTRVSSLGRSMTALPSQALSMEPEAVVARQFDERLRNAVERHHLRVLGVRADRAREAALALGERLEIEPVPFDRLLVDAIREQMAKGGIQKDSIVHDADRGGRDGKNWSNLMRLIEAAAASVAEQLLPPKEPLLLVQPGLLARYQLTSFLERLVASAKSAEAPILLLVPAHDTGGIPSINGELSIPGLHPSQALWVPLEWLANRHNAAA
ncbi:MAG: BREX system serine/threonine kinase PglW [Deltaproteobacteria bacterium]|nr:BREX system serine/threonine kinase PglW [Deltaproteobacteria bacterium]